VKLADLPRKADVVVIGGGSTGASALYHLVAAGCRSAILIERETLGAGSTGKAAGGIRAQFSDELNIRMALENIRRFERFEEEIGVDIDFKQWGYLIMIADEMLDAFKAALELQNGLGVPSEFLTPEEIPRIVPLLRREDLAGATYCPLDGYATPESVVQGYASAALRGGGRVVQGCTVRALITNGNKIAGVETDRGTIETETVILAAGVWSVELAAAVGLQLPVTPVARHVWLTEPGDPLPHELPLTIDFATGFYFHREGDGLLFGGRESSLEDVATHAVHRLPLLEELGVKTGWWGYYEMSPDHNAIVGQTESPTGLLYATGFSGHGFQQAPVVGEHLADLALGRSVRFDLSPFSVARFESAAEKPERYVI
jgi:glycine/D-amino acid oxidase-like deaminating enzyme